MKRRYRLLHPEYCLRQLAIPKTPEYRRRNAEAKRESRLLYPDRYKQFERVYRQSHPEVMYAKTKRWRLAHPEHNRLISRIGAALRYARLRGSPKADFSQEDWKGLLTEYNNSCVYCGDRGNLSIDHIIPVSKGGKHTKENIVPACISCNSRKGDKSLIVFLNKLYSL